MEIVIKIPERLWTKQLTADDYIEIVNAVANGTPLDSIIADIEAARDKDKLCEYPYNRCIDILRRAGE